MAFHPESALSDAKIGNLHAQEIRVPPAPRKEPIPDLDIQVVFERSTEVISSKPILAGHVGQFNQPLLCVTEHYLRVLMKNFP